MITNQKGAFTIEVGIMSLMISMIFLFLSEVVVIISINGMLSRLADSSVVILGEREQLYNQGEIKQPQVEQIRKIVSRSLRGNFNGFDDNGLSIHLQVYDEKSSRVLEFNSGNYTCEAVNNVSQLSYISPILLNGKKENIYLITLCYKRNPFFGYKNILRSEAISLSREQVFDPKKIP